MDNTVAKENGHNCLPDELILRKRKLSKSALKRDTSLHLERKLNEPSNGKCSPVFKNGGHDVDDHAIKLTALQRIKDNIMNLQHSMLEQIESELSSVAEQYWSEVQSPENIPKAGVFNGERTLQEKRVKRPSGSLPAKQFVPRNSLLTDLLEVNHIRAIYHIFIATMIILFINTLIYDLADMGRLNLEFGLIKYAFGNFHSVLLIWVGMMSATLVVVYPAFNFWASKRVLFETRSLQQRSWDYLWLTIYVAYIVIAIYVPVKEVIIQELPPASSLVILMEQARLLMKTHAFVRSNILAVPSISSVKPKAKDEDSTEEGSPCPDFSKYLYFLFAPTLVYRNHYPRTRSIRWKWVVWNFLQVVGVLFYFNFVLVRFCVPAFSQFGREPLTPKYLVLLFFGGITPGGLILVSGFFALLHAWHNAFAEMLRFADRMFYKDWWNASSYSTYYRTWNVIVHDWLYTYIYKDVHDLCRRRSRMIPMLVVFATSAIVHEFILSFTFRFFCPILLFQFGVFGIVFAMINNKKETRMGNIFVWLTLLLGTGIQASVYSMEWYARINCPQTWDGWMDYVIPRSLSCYVTKP